MNNNLAYQSGRNPQIFPSQQFNGQSQMSMQVPYDNTNNYYLSQSQFNGQLQIPAQTPYVQPFGLKEVDGLVGANRYPVAPGATVALKDANGMTLFVKSVDLSGALLPLRVFTLTEITQEYQDRETPVSRAEFNQLSNTMNDLSGAISGMRQLLEDLTAPSATTQAVK